METIQVLLNKIYGSQQARVAFERLAPRIEQCRISNTDAAQRFSEKDAVLITYGDSLFDDIHPPMQTLYDFACDYFKGLFSTVHFLPFFPYSSDDGFSVMDFFAIDPSMGSWQNVERFSQSFELMFDYVLNHVSAKGQWFENYLDGRPGFNELAIEVSPDEDLSQVTRPRALPLLTPFTKANGEKVHVWTTFSEDQIDLNYQSIDVFLHMVDVLLFYVQKGARWLRLDAVAYLWKEIGSPCIHHEKTHDMVRLLRCILDQVAPQVVMITETNVPHRENITYFGNGSDEAQLVYNFTLPPLLLHTFMADDAQALTEWAQGLETPGSQTAFFNFTASHDGIGVRPLEGILSDRQVDGLLHRVEQNGGHVSYKQNSNGSKSPYELNITYVDALSRGDQWDTRRFLASQAIQMALPGVPGIYIHSILGTRNWYEGVEQTGRARTINRKKLELKSIRAQLDDPLSFRSQIFYPYSHMLRTRCAQAAFHPNAAFEVLLLDRGVFAVKRQCKDQLIYAITNVTASQVTVELKSEGVTGRLTDLLTAQQLESDSLTLSAYQSVWLTLGP